MNRRDFLKTVALGTTGASLGALAGADAKAATCPLAKTYDVIVVGGGPAGVCAAIAAARNGAKTLLVEEGGCLGGMATKGLVGPFMTCYDTKGETQIIKGLFDEIVRRLVKIGGAIHPSQCRAGTCFSAWHVAGHDHVTPFEPEKLKLVLDEMCEASGVEVLFHTVFAEPVLEGKRICGVRVVNKGGASAYGAKVVVDATGDGDVAFRAGVPCVAGDPERGGAMQPATLFFRIAGLKQAELEADIKRHTTSRKRYFAWYVDAAKAAGEWDLPRPHINIYRQVRDDEWFVNVSRLLGVDATDAVSLSRAEREGRRQVRTIFNVFRKYFPGGENVRLMSVASTVGIRESRHVKGEYWMDKDDILDGRVPADTIARCAYAIDLHAGKGKSGTLFLTVRKGTYYGIPYRSLVPLEIENLLVAGRCLSGSSVAAASYRVMPPAMATGEAAGTAAALCAKGGVEPRRLDVQSLLAALRNGGAEV